MAKDPWEVVSIEPISKDPWEVVSVDDLPKEESFFSLDRAKRVAKDVASLIPGMEDVAEPQPKAATKPQMTPQQIERQAAMDAGERENLRAINPKAEDYQINALLEQRRAARANPMPAPTVDDRAAGYLEKSPTMSEADAQRNAAFDVSLEQRMNRKFQQAEADPISGERIAVAYQPEREAERTAFEQQQLDDANLTLNARRRSAESPLLSDLASGVLQAAVGTANAPQAVVNAVIEAGDRLQGLMTGTDGDAPKLAKWGFTEDAMKLAQAAMSQQSQKELVQAYKDGDFREVLLSKMAANSVPTALSLASMFIPALRPALLPTMGAMAGGSAYAQGDSAIGAVTKGGIEVATEMLPLKAFDEVMSAVTRMPLPVQNSVLQVFGQKVLKAGTALTVNAATGALEESIAQVGGNAVDILIEQKQGVGLTDGVADAAILGGITGKVLTLPAVAMIAAQPGSKEAVAARALSDALSGGEFAPTDVVDILRQESSLTGGEIRPEATVMNAGRQAQVELERQQLEAMRSTQTQTTREAEAAIGAAQTVDEAIALANNAVNQGSTLADITNRVNQADQLAATINSLTTNAASAAAPVEDGRVQPMPTYQTAELAQADAEQQGVADRVEVRDTGDGFVLAPKVNAPTIKQLRDEGLAVSDLKSGIERSGASTSVEYRGGWTLDAAGASEATAARSGDAVRATRLVAQVAGQAFGVAPIPVRGLGAFGVAYNGRIYVDVDEVAKAGVEGKSSDAALGIATIGHEATHALLERSSNPEDRKAYANFKAVVLQYARPGVVESRRQSEEAAAGGAAQAGEYGTTRYAEGEVVADVSGAMWLDTKFWQRLYEVDNGSTMRRVLYKFMQAATRFMEVAKGSRLDAARFVTNVDAVREAAAQAWASRAQNQQPPKEIADAPAFSKLGVSAEVAPDPRNSELAQRWDALKPADKDRITREVMDDLAPRVFDELGLQGWSVDYTTGSFEGKVNPSAVLRAAPGATVEQLGEVMRVFGYVLDQKGMVAFDENNTTSDKQAGFVKVVLPKGLSAGRIDAIRQTISDAVPQADGDTLRDGALVFGNFSEYNPGVATLSDEAFKQAIVDALVASNPAEDIDVVGPFRFHSEYDQAYWEDEYNPEGRNKYLDGTRYASDQPQAKSRGNRLRGRSGRDDARSRIEDIAEATDERVRQLVAAVSYSRLDDAAGRPGDGAAAGDRAAVRGAIHFGRTGRLSSLSGSSSGTGIKGAEQERLKTAKDARIKRRVYFYLPVGGDKQVPVPEIGLGAHVYSADLDGLYDPTTASKPIRGAGNDLESAVLDAGYKGYINREQGTVVVLNTDVPVQYLGTADQFDKIKRSPTVAKPKQATRQEGDELVRRPEGSELSQIVKVREEITFAAPSFKLQYGEARVLASEAAMADQILADAGSSFQFGGPQFSMADDFDELGAFNLDTNDFADGIEVTEKKNLDFDALQAELDAEMGRARGPARRNSIMEPTDQQLKDAGLHPERAIPFGELNIGATRVTFESPALRAESGTNYNIRVYLDENDRPTFRADTSIGQFATFTGASAPFGTAQAAGLFVQNQLAGDYLHKRFDLVDVYRKSTVMKIAEGWRAMAKVEGALKYQNTATKSESFTEVAMALGLFKDYKVSVEYDEVVIFKHRQTGREFQAVLIERAETMACCTMELNGSDLGVPFYVVAGKVAQNKGKPFVADETLSAINTMRRTEQALSFALRTGDTGVLLPGPQNRVYGYNEKPKTAQDHNENIARLALANLRNVEEFIPEVRRWTYDPTTGQFGDEAKVAAALKDPDVRAMGMGRTTIARAVLTNQVVMNTLQPGEIEAMAAPVLYSRITREDDPQPPSESWGQLNADGSVEMTPQFKAWFGDSKVVDAEGKPLVVYHGTSADITTFAPEKSADGVFHFAIDTAMANRFAVSRASDGVRGANVMPVYLAIKKPKRVAFINTMEIEAAKAEGYDGLIAENRGHLVAFEPAQIKSAIGNNGQFDPENPDIRYSRNAVEDYMVGRNREMRQVTGNAQQVADIAKAMRAVTELAKEMRAVHEDESRRFSGEDLQKAVMAKFRNYVLPIGRTPHVLTMLGAPNQMMKIDPSIVYKVFVDKHANDLEGAQPKDIIEGIYKPAMVLKSGDKEFELVLPIVTSTGPLIAPVMTEAVMPTNGKKVSAIMSIYPRKVALGGDSILQRIKNGKLLYADAALAQVALTGNATPQVGIDAREVSLSSGTPPTRTSQANVSDAANPVKPLNPYYVGWDKAKDDVVGGITSKKVKSDLDLMKWIGNNFRGDWADAPSFSRNPLSPNYKLDPESKWLKTQRTFQDYFNRVQQVQQMIADQGGTVREESNTYRAEERSYGRIHEQVKDFADKWVRPMVEKAAKAGVTMDELSLYAYAMHAKERNARVARINPNLPDGGSGMTDAEADAIIAQVQADPRGQAMADLHGDLMAITATTRRVLLEDGLITDEQYAQLDGMYQNYVPLRGFENESDPRIQQLLEEGGSRLGTGQGFSIRGNETLRALGRRTKAGDIIENIINDYQRAVVRGEKNAVARTFYQFVLDNPSPNLWEIDADKTKRSLGLDGMVKEKVVLDKDDSTTVAVKLQGNEVFIKVKDPLLVRALKKMHNDDMGDQLRTITNGLNVYTSLMRNTLTRFNPEFAIVNLVRDAGFGTLAVLDELGEAGVAKFWKHYAAANASSHRYEMGNLDPVNNVMDRYFTEYRMAGGTTGGFYMKDADQVRSDIRDLMLAAGASPTNWVEKVKTFGGKASPYQAALKAGKVLEHIGAVSENAARVAAYRAAREMGRTPAEAAKIAKNLTTNFNRKGEYGQLLNSLFVFFNAAVQGAERTVKLMKNPKVQGYLGGMVASSMAIALLNAWGAGDDEDDGEAYWDKIPDHVKERNLIIMLPPGTQEGEQVGSNGRYLAIPVQYGLNVFTTLGYSMADMLRHYGQDKTRGRDALKAGLDLASVTFGSFNPFGGSVDNKHAAAMIVLPSAADVVYQLANGVNAFGTPVAPFKSELDAKPDSENVNARQAGGPAHEIARWLNSATGGDDTVAGWVDVSPGTLENVWTSLTGGTGRFINDVATLGLNGLEYANGGDPDIFINKVPVFRKVYGEVDGAVDQGLFYDRRRQIQEARQEVKGKEESGREVMDSKVIALDSMATDANKFTRAVSDIRKQMIEIGKDPDMTPTEKRTLIRELKAERDTLTREFNKMFIETMRAEAAGDFAVAE